MNLHKLRTLIPMEELEYEAQQQIYNALNLDFLKLLAIMPDCHTGYTLPIGGVALLDNVISPEYVGYDEGCFTGDTKVSLLNSEEKTLEELTHLTEPFWVYSMDDDKNIVPGKAIALKTGINKPVMIIELDNNEKIQCTLDHKFMLRDGSYKEAKDLKKNDSLMPLYRKLNGWNHVKVYQPKNKTYRLSGYKEMCRLVWYNIYPGTKPKIIHHKDKNGRNDNPENLIPCSSHSEHGKYHKEDHSNHLRSEGFKIKRKESLKEKGGYYDKQSETKKKEKVRSIYFDNKKVDVYCLKVEKYHNFALSSGVFVHNCGMCAIITDINVNDLTDNKKYHIFFTIKETIPLGFSIRDHGLNYPDFKSASNNKDLDKKVNDKLCKSIGTLGGGNHFIELGSNRQGNLTITLHSGSRNVGHSIASFYMQKSKEVDRDLPNGFLHLNGEFGQMFLQDLKFAQDFALANRMKMLNDILKILGTTFKNEFTFINENHNHAIVTSSGVLHRKGATPADKDQLGVIPGNMRDGVYITRGLGNEEYLSSASHGAGRKFSRTKAKANIKLDVFEKQMKGIIADINNGLLDESPDAYKDVQYVIKAQENKVIEVIDYVKPIINIKANEVRKRRK